MPKLFIIGNGFDLAHGYKTSYTDFFNYLFSSTNTERSNELFEIRERKSRLDNGVIQNVQSINFKNALFKTMYQNHTSKTWSDIEEDYFNELYRKAFTDSYTSPQWKKVDILKLNNEFTSIRENLKRYLSSEIFPITLSVQKLDSVRKLIRTMVDGDPDVEVLNFNYSEVAKNYFLGKEIISIHGELNNIDNPIVFGYAAREEDTTELSKIYDDEYIKYIKRFLYLTDGQSRLNKFLDQNSDIEIIILGHSCGMSDRLILNKIFNHKDVEKITVCYYNSLESYRAQTNNIYRLLNNKNDFDKVVNFSQSPKFPQMNNELTTIEATSN